MDFLQIDPRMDEHPDIEAAGFDGARVFEAVLRACARNDGRGRLRGKFAHPGWLARRMNLTREVIGGIDPDTWVNHGLERCVRCGLLERDGQDVIIPGWEKFYSPKKTGAERTADWEQRKRGRQSLTPTDEADDERQSASAPSVTDATPLHSTPQNTTEEAGARPVQLQEVWNRDAHPALPRWSEMPAGREKKARARLKEKPLAVWAQVIERINASTFLRGETDRGWKAGPDWLLKPDTAAKVLEGQYDDHRGPSPPRRDAGPPDPFRRPAGDPCVGCGGYTDVKFGDEWRCYPCGREWEESDEGQAARERWLAATGQTETREEA